MHTKYGMKNSDGTSFLLVVHTNIIIHVDEEKSCFLGRGFFHIIYCIISAALSVSSNQNVHLSQPYFLHKLQHLNPMFKWAQNEVILLLE